MTYRTIHTTYGLQQIAQAEATGIPLNLTHMAVGDGNGNAVEPTQGQTQLARELFRAAINRVYQDPQNALKFTAELIVPSDVGGFTIREVGIFDASGSLFAVANTPPAYKPTASEGAFSDGVYRMEFLVTNAGAVTIQADPATAVATHLWVINNVTAGVLIPGGTTGQLLTKNSNANGDVEWTDPDAVTVVVDTIEEPQTLAAAQTVVTLAVCTTNGLAVYVDGVRIAKGSGADKWLPDATNPDTKVVLGTAATAGQKFLGVQNEPAGAAPFPLQRDQNLADVADKALGRANLDVFSKAEARQMAPASMVAHFARVTAPTGWLKANGAAVSRVAYADLFAAIGITFGAGDGFNTFNLPDLRGEFIRSWDDGRGVDAGRAWAGVQGSQNLQHGHTYIDPGHSHPHTIPFSNENGGSNPWGSGGGGFEGWFPYSVDPATTGISINSSGGNEARPRNIALLACIKY